MGRITTAGAPADPLVPALGLRAGRTVLVLGTGDASLCRRLGETGVRLIVADPSTDARAQIAPRVPSAEIIDGVPGDVPLPQWGTDVVVTDQPDFWLVARESADELYRILIPDGLVAAIGDSSGAVLEGSGFRPEIGAGDTIRVWRKP